MAKIKNLFQYKSEEAIAMGFESWNDLVLKLTSTEFDAINANISRRWAESYTVKTKMEHKAKTEGVPYKNVSEKRLRNPFNPHSPIQNMNGTRD